MLTPWPLSDGSPRRRSATARSVLAGEASAEAARKSAEVSPEPPFPVPGDEQAAAFFDLDNTVMQGAALFHFGRGLYKRKFFETRDLARFAWRRSYELKTLQYRAVRTLAQATSRTTRADRRARTPSAVPNSPSVKVC
ncbi:hypothetical protein SGLAM104S_00962 [Streptomyces glaucescens]